ncbi:MAG TPA: hypothetical protein VHO84_14825, partial [Syntrophorhabdaceae bacterium]|nr:hypothetical protein [Syntrophorhabdaceae bacterium]
MRTDGSTFIKTRLVFLLFYVISVFGCATSLPDITAAERAYAGGVPTIVGPQGPLSEKESKQTLTNLKRAAGSPQLLEKHVSLMQSLSGFPLTSENRAQLLIDGPATNEAMFRAISKAIDHINLETFIFEDDDVGRQVSELLLRKQTEGVQVNIIYDSLGSKSTPPEFFDRLKMAGAGILEFNPVNPLKTQGKAKF